jgi:hypothetical protein
MEELKRALNEMQDKFSSNEFASLSRRYGITDKQIKNKVANRFLLQNCIQINRKSWAKKNTNSLFDNKHQEEQAVLLLKSLGYKVYKPVTEYQEL